MWQLIKTLSIKNLKKKKLRSVLLMLLIAFLSSSLFLGLVTVKSLQNGLNNYQARLGADVIVVPYEATSKSTIDDILLQGISGNYYIDKAHYNKVNEINGIEKISGQFYLTSAKASCCSTRVQIIGFDPESDFSIQPWIETSYKKEISDMDIVVGSNINIPENRRIKFYGDYYNVVAQLAKTGTGLDSAVYANIITVKHMAETSSALTYNEELQDIDIETSVSAIFIKVGYGFSGEDVANRINMKVKGVKAQSSASMVSNISGGLSSISTIIGVLLGVVWFLAIIILIIAFVLITNERKKEFAILRTLGASRKMLAKIITSESLIAAGISSIVGVAIGAIMLIPLSTSLKDLLDLPFLMPNIGLIIIFGFVTIAITVLACYLSSLKASYDISKDDAAILIREDA